MGSSFKAIDKMSQQLGFYRDRHAVLTGNVANIDTPDYKPLDLERVDPAGVGDPNLAIRSNVGLLGGTNERHVAAANNSQARPFARVVEKNDPSISGDGNGVSLERELAKIDINKTRYATTARLISARFALLRYSMEK